MRTVTGVLAFVGLIFISVNSFALEVKCQNENECHGSVVALEIELTPLESQLTGKKFDYCSGFLMAPDKVMTNGHCIYGRVGYPATTRAGQSCLRVKIYLPQTKEFKKEEVDCRQLESITSWDPRTNQSLPDFAVLLLSKSVKRPVIAMSKKGIDDDSVHKSVAYNFTLSGQTVTATQRIDSDCKVDMANESRPFSSRYSPMIFYNNCSLIPGNSGSVLLNSKGEAVSLATAMTDFSGKRNLFGENFQDSGVATNLSCLDSVMGTEKLEGVRQACDLNRFIENQYEILNTILERLDLKIEQNLRPSSYIPAVEKYYSHIGSIKYKKSVVMNQKNGSYLRDWSPMLSCLNRNVLGISSIKVAVSDFKKKVIVLEAPTFWSEGGYNKAYRFVASRSYITKILYKLEILRLNQTSFEVLISPEDASGKRYKPEQTAIPFCH